jgi:hypothetical protein
LNANAATLVARRGGPIFSAAADFALDAAKKHKGA